MRLNRASFLGGAFIGVVRQLLILRDDFQSIRMRATIIEKSMNEETYTVFKIRSRVDSQNRKGL